MSKKVKVGYSLTREAYEALSEMTQGYKGYGAMVSALIIAERDRRRERDALATMARIDKRLEQIDKRLKAVEGGQE